MWKRAFKETLFSGSFVNSSKRKSFQVQSLSFDQDFMCSDCNFISTNQRKVSLHRSKEHNGTFCKICDKTFDTKEIFENHMKIHDNIDAKGQKCKICEMKFDSFRGF
jgi:transcription elongation factor Elf1